MVASRTTRWKHKVSSVSPECLERGYPGDCCRSCRTADHECGPSVTSASRWPLISASKQSSDYELGFFFTLKRFGELKSQSTRIWRLASEKNSKWVSRQAVRAEIQGWRIWEEVNGDMLAGIQLGVNEVCQHVELLGGLAEARPAWEEWNYQANYRAGDQAKGKLEPWSLKIGWKVTQLSAYKS